MRGFLALLIGLALAGCSHRERANPFDPGNPGTRGVPAGFAAVAGGSNITLQWIAASAPDLVGYRLFRRIEGEAEFQAIGGLIPPSTSRFQDFGLANGVVHHYRLYYMFSAGLAARPAEDSAIPGALRPWVADLGISSLLRITPDARYVSFRDPMFSGPIAVAVDIVSGVVWTVDEFAARVILLNPATGGRIAISGFADPVAVAVDSRRQVGWICDIASNQVFSYDQNGDPVLPISIEPLSAPLSVAVDPGDGSVWICENTGARVSRFDENGIRLAAAPVTRPSRVAVDSLSHTAWVTSFSQRGVFRLAPNGALLDTIGGFQGPIGVAVDWRRGRIWVADAVASELLALRRDGSIEFRVGGLGEVREVAVDLATGDAWATLPAAKAVARVGASGSPVRTVLGLGQPIGIALDPGVR